MAEWALVALGSNLGDRQAYLTGGREHLAAIDGITLVAESLIEETEAIGSEGHPPYQNQMVLLRTELHPHDLLSACQAGEDAAGRQRQERWGPRTLDLDIVWFGDCTVDDPDLTIPHVELRNRGFWLREMTELLPRTWAGPANPQLPEWAVVKEGRRAHIVRVAALLGTWAIAMGQTVTERNRWLRAAFLHDALRDAPREMLLDLSGSPGAAPKLLHGPAAAEMAARTGERDEEILDAVRYHSIGFRRWGAVGRMLYLADYLEPGRRFKPEERAALAARVPNDPDGVLFTVAGKRLIRAIEAGHELAVEGTEFWNEIARSVQA